MDAGSIGSLPALLLVALLGACMPPRPSVLKIGDRFRIDTGDGDQQFFSEPKDLRLTDAAWFSRQLPRGEALLFIVENGPYSGKYVAVTSRVVEGLEDQIASRGVASVVVHLVSNPTSSFDGSTKDAFPIGMAAIWRA